MGRSINHCSNQIRRGRGKTSDRMAQVHAHAQDVFADRKLKTSISKLVSMLLETRPRISLFNSNNKIEKLVTSVIQTTASIFHYKDFNPDAYVLVIGTELWPPTPPDSMSSWILGGVAGGVATGAVYGVMSPFARTSWCFRAHRALGWGNCRRWSGQRPKTWSWTDHGLS
ncbi:hypothetical protein BDZ45DRAFT_433206 [Acephala macrosclerotiorum]|nr:hypothetical protein BDZ45DRAFT_433206 [Acephala macrosclerotiorum]